MAERVDVKCTFCEKKQQFMKLCSRCRSDVYCSKECQVKDWPTHKKKCIITTKQSAEQSNEIAALNGNCHSSSKSRKETAVTSPSKDQATESFAKTSIEDSYSEKLTDETCTEKQCLSEGIFSNLSTKDNDILIYIKHSKIKSELRVMSSQDGDSIYQQVSNLVRIPTGKLKLVCKGKIIAPEDISNVIHNKAVFLALGEVAENEDGIHTGDIETLMQQLNVERNVAVRALKKTGSLLDAIFDVGNNL